MWRSWLARTVWDRQVEGSSPFTPTKFIEGTMQQSYRSPVRTLVFIPLILQLVLLPLVLAHQKSADGLDSLGGALLAIGVCFWTGLTAALLLMFILVPGLKSKRWDYVSLVVSVLCILIALSGVGIATSV